MGIFDEQFFQRALELQKGANTLGDHNLRLFERDPTIRAMLDCGSVMDEFINLPWKRAVDQLWESPTIALYRDIERGRVGGYGDSTRGLLPDLESFHITETFPQSLPFWDKFAQDVSVHHATLDALAGSARHLEEAIKKLSEYPEWTRDIGAVISNASKIREPWLDLLDPESSLLSLGLMRGIGQTLARTDLFETSARTFLKNTLGEWDPLDHDAFRALSVDLRRETIISSGFDERLSAIPQPAYPDAVWVSGIGPRPRELRATRGVLVHIPRATAAYVYTVIRFVERALRRVIEERFSTRYGPRWVETRVHKDMRDRWESVREGRGAGAKHGTLRYSELGDLLQLIVRNDHWKECFVDSVATNDREELRVSMSRLIAIRRPTAHSDDVSTEELMVCLVEGTRILRTFGLSVPWRIEEQVYFQDDDLDPDGPT